MKPNVRMRDRHLLALFLVALASLVIGSLVTAKRVAGVLPDAIRYVPVDATAFAVTTGLGRFWKTVPAHTGRLLTAAAGEAGRVADELERNLANRCLSLAHSTTPKAFGLDPDRGLSAAVLGRGGAGVVVSLPVTDPEQFRVVLQRLSAEPNSISVAARGDGRTAARYQIEAMTADGVAVCDSTGRPIDPPFAVVPAQDLEDRTLTLHVSPLHETAGTFSLSCRVQFEDGGHGDCACDGEDCTTARPIAGLTSLEPVEARAAWWRLDKWIFAPVGGDVVLVAQDIGLIDRTLANTADNLGAFQGDDSLLSSLSLLTADADRDAGQVFGVARSVPAPVFGNVPFLVELGGESLLARLLVSPETLRTALLQQLIAPHDRPLRAPIMQSGLSLAVNDPRLGHYLRSVRDFVAPGTGDLGPGLETLRPLFEQIMEYDGVGQLTLWFLGVRDGVPDFAAVLDVAEPSVYDAILLGQRRVLREERDRAVLQAAIRQYRADHGRRPAGAVELEPYLGDEAEALVERYDVRRSALPLTVDALPAGLFDGPDYRDPHTRGISYIYAPVGDNDVRYRFSDSEREATDIEALRQNRFRLAVRDDPAKAVMTIGVDAGALSRLPARPYRAAARGDRNAGAKVIAHGDPEWVIDQMRLYPSPGVRDAVTDTGLGLLDQYRYAELSITPQSDPGGLVVTLELRHAAR